MSTDGWPERFRLDGKVALVTGGSRGLGRAIAHGLAEVGADVVIASRHLEACAKTAEEIEKATGRHALAHACHVGHWNELPGLIDATYGEFGRLDVLINNAGMSPQYGQLTDVTEALFDKVIAVNLKGAFRLGTLAGERMTKTGSGSIINISSTAATRPRPDLVPYAAAKAGLNAVTTGLAHAYAPSVRCNAIMAGTFLTDVSKHWDPQKFQAWAETFALRRGGQPDEIVGAALYLASDASSYTTGAILTIDGGQP